MRPRWGDNDVGVTVTSGRCLRNPSVSSTLLTGPSCHFNTGRQRRAAAALFSATPLFVPAAGRAFAVSAAPTIVHVLA